MPNEFFIDPTPGSTFERVQAHADTAKMFELLPSNPKTTTLRNRYDYLSKTWLLAAKAASQRASGTQETDEELCVLIKAFVLQEEVCPVLIPQSMNCAGKAFRSSRAPHCPRRS